MAQKPSLTKTDEPMKMPFWDKLSWVQETGLDPDTRTGTTMPWTH